MSDWLRNIDWQATATLVLSIWGAIRGAKVVKDKVAPKDAEYRKLMKKAQEQLTKCPTSSCPLQRGHSGPCKEK